MKNIILTLSIICIFTISKLQAQIVYVTATDKIYHTKFCNIMSKAGRVGVLLADVKKQGYTPCQTCKPDALVPPKQQPKDKPKSKK